MATCFVIQPFDRGPFDKRFDDIIAPAIRDAGLEPYRVDRDPAVSVPIDAIEMGIKEAEACVADITTTNNPNVWFELGYAIAIGKPVVLLALKDPARRYPFDVQHRHVIEYRTDAPTDFALLHAEVAQRLRYALQRKEQLSTLARHPAPARIAGLTQPELAALIVLSQRTEN